MPDEPKDADDDTGGAARPFPGSLCWRCAHHRRVDGARSTFVMCTALAVRYPRQPVERCGAFEAQPLPPR
jgi:hypothetical protein